jgi:hypothetical protein
MNTGTIVTNALNRLSLSVNDYNMRQMALDMLNEICQEHWIYKGWKFRKLNDTLTTAVGTAEYSLHRRLGSLSDIVNSSLRGSDPVRTIGFMATEDFYKQHPYEVVSGTPYKSYPGQIKGVQNDPSAASVITFTSSFTNYTSGTVAVIQGSNRVVFSSGAIPANYIGAWFRVTGDQRAYQLQKNDLASGSIFYLNAPYEGSTAGTATFIIGDINQKASVTGIVGTATVEEEVQLNGSTAVATVNSFTSLIKISKSDKTMGYITATSNAAAVSNVILDAGETDHEFFYINLYPTPSAIESVTYEFSSQHPILYKNSDAPVFPAQYHPLLQLDLYIKLASEWLKQEVSQTVLARREQLLRNMVDIDNNTDNWKKLQETEYMSTRAKISNLPPMYGTDYDDQAL